MKGCVLKMAFLMENLSTIIILLLVIGAAVLAIRAIIRDKKAGKACGSCPGGCHGCHGSCGGYDLGQHGEK